MSFMRPRAAFVGFLSLAYFSTQAAFAHLPETRFWEERRRQVLAFQTNSMQMAALPAATSPLLPAPSEKMAALPSRWPALAGRAIPTHLSEVIQALPSERGTVRGLLLPSQASGPIVVHMQDVHMNQDAQKNLAVALDSLIRRQKTDLVALEGAFGDLDLAPFRQGPRPDIVRVVADFFLKENKISGPVHTLLTSTSPIAALGVDDRAHYDANVAAYRKAAPQMTPLQKPLSAWSDKIEAQKRDVFSPVLLAFDKSVQSYRQGRTSLSDHLKALADQVPLRPEAHKFLQALALESSLDFRRVETQRAAILARLAAQMTPAARQELMNHALAHRLGRVSYAQFYGFLERQCGQAGISLAQFPAFQTYMQYVMQADRIDADKLFENVTAMEQAAYKRLTQTQAQGTLIQESRLAHLTQKLIDFSLTSDEWQEYKSMKVTHSQSGREIEQEQTHFFANLKSYPLSPGERVAEGRVRGYAFDLFPFESFYHEAEARDQAMSQNLLAAIAARKPKVAVLVTGGFHARGLEEKLRQANLTVVAFVPRIEKLEDVSGGAYLSVFSREKTPLEKLFAGEKLFLPQETFPAALPADSALHAAGVGAYLGLPRRMVEDIYSSLAKGWGVLRRASVKGNSVETEVEAAGALITSSIDLETSAAPRTPPREEVVSGLTIKSSRTFVSPVHPLMSLKKFLKTQINRFTTVPDFSFWETLPVSSKKLVTSPIYTGRGLAKPILAVFDLHGTLLEPTWREEYANVYAHLMDLSADQRGQVVQWMRTIRQRPDDDIVQILHEASGKPVTEVKEVLYEERARLRKHRTPPARPGAREFVEALRARDVPVAVVTGSGRDLATEQLRLNGFFPTIGSEMVIARDDMVRSKAPGDGYSPDDRKRALESLQEMYPEYQIVHFNDWIGGHRTVQDLGGLTFGLPQGEGAEKEENTRVLRAHGAEVMLDGWDQWPDLLKALHISTDLQKRAATAKPPIAEGAAKEVAVVMPAARSPGGGLLIEILDDGTIAHSEVVDDHGVAGVNGGALNFRNLLVRPLASFPSGGLVTPIRYLRRNLPTPLKETVLGLLALERRYTKIDNVIASWLRSVDQDVWTTNIDTEFLHRRLSGVLRDPHLRKAVEIGVGGGHLSCLIADRAENLQELSITDISRLALRCAVANLLTYLRPGVRLRTYLGKGLKTLPDGQADLIVVNPPYIPVRPGEKNEHEKEVDPYRGTGLIHEVLEWGVQKLNPDNPNACIVMGMSSLAQFDEIRRKFPDLEIEKLGETKKVSLKIDAITKDKEWVEYLLKQGGLERNPQFDRTLSPEEQENQEEEPYLHTLSAYRIRPRLIPSERAESARPDVFKDPRVYLKSRLGEFRAERRRQGEPLDALSEVVDSLNDTSASRLARILSHAHITDLENVGRGLTPMGLVKLLTLALVLAENAGLEKDRKVHIDFSALFHNLSDGTPRVTLYKERMVEAYLRTLDLEELALGSGDPGTLASLASGLPARLGSFTLSTKFQTVSLDFNFSPQGQSLATLLSDYEISESLELHVEWDRLLDIYGLRIDAWDRVGREQAYLEAMEKSKDDKERLLRYALGPVLVDVGSADGIFLELAEKYKNDLKLQRIIGMDISKEAVRKLEERIYQKKLSSEAREGDAERLPERLAELGVPAPNTIVFSSTLHEIPDRGKVLAGAIQALAPGGRLLIRDGLMPPNAGQEIDLELRGQDNWKVFQKFMAEFPFRDLSNAFQVVGGDEAEQIRRIRLRAEDAAEFLFKLSWCYRDGKFQPTSLSKEIKEQYCVMTRDEYVHFIKGAGAKAGVDMKEIQLPAEEQAYLQAGYANAWQGHARLLAPHSDEELPFPPSNMMMVFEKPGPGGRPIFPPWITTIAAAIFLLLTADPSSLLALTAPFAAAMGSIHVKEDDGGRNSIDPLSDAAINPLLARAAAGDERAFEILAERYTNPIKIIFRANRIPEEEIEAWLSEAFLRMWRNIPNFDPQRGSFTSYVRRIAKNLAIDYRRERIREQNLRRRVESQILGSQDDGMLSHGEFRRGMQKVELTHALSQLQELALISGIPLQTLKMLWLQYVGGFKAREMAVIFDMPLGSVLTSMARSKGKLKKLSEAQKIWKEFFPGAPLKMDRKGHSRADASIVLLALASAFILGISCLSPSIQDASRTAVNFLINAFRSDDLFLMPLVAAGAMGFVPAIGHSPVMYGELSDENVKPLVARAAAGDEAALKDLLEILAPYMRGFFRWRGVLDEDDLEDYIARMHMKIWMTLGTYDPAQGSYLGFLSRTMRNLLKDDWRKSRVRQGVYKKIDTKPDFVDVDVEMDDSHVEELVTQLAQIARELNISERNWTYLYLAYKEGYGPAELARLFQLPETKIRLAMWRARKKLRNSEKAARLLADFLVLNRSQDPQKPRKRRKPPVDGSQLGHEKDEGKSEEALETPIIRVDEQIPEGRVELAHTETAAGLVGEDETVPEEIDRRSHPAMVNPLLPGFVRRLREIIESAGISRRDGQIFIISSFNGLSDMEIAELFNLGETDVSLAITRVRTKISESEEAQEIVLGVNENLKSVDMRGLREIVATGETFHRHWQAFVARKFIGLSGAEVGEIFGLTLANVHIIVSRIENKLSISAEAGKILAGGSADLSKMWSNFQGIVLSEGISYKNWAIYLMHRIEGSPSKKVASAWDVSWQRVNKIAVEVEKTLSTSARARKFFMIGPAEQAEPALQDRELKEAVRRLMRFAGASGISKKDWQMFIAKNYTRMSGVEVAKIFQMPKNNVQDRVSNAEAILSRSPLLRDAYEKFLIEFPRTSKSKTSSQISVNQPLIGLPQMSDFSNEAHMEMTRLWDGLSLPFSWAARLRPEDRETAASVRVFSDPRGIRELALAGELGAYENVISFPFQAAPGEFITVQLAGPFPPHYNTEKDWQELLTEVMSREGVDPRRLLDLPQRTLTVILANNYTHHAGNCTGDGIIILHTWLFDRHWYMSDTDFQFPPQHIDLAVRAQMLTHLAHELFFHELPKIGTTADEHERESRDLENLFFWGHEAAAVLEAWFLRKSNLAEPRSLSWWIQDKLRTRYPFDFFKDGINDPIQFLLKRGDIDVLKMLYDTAPAKEVRTAAFHILKKTKSPGFAGSSALNHLRGSLRSDKYAAKEVLGAWLGRLRDPFLREEALHILSSWLALKEYGYFIDHAPLQALMEEWVQRSVSFQKVAKPQHGLLAKWGRSLAFRQYSAELGQAVRLVVKYINLREFAPTEAYRLAFAALALAYAGVPVEEILVPVLIQKEPGKRDAFGYLTRHAQPWRRLTDPHVNHPNVARSLDRLADRLGALFSMGAFISLSPASHSPQMPLFEFERVFKDLDLEFVVDAFLFENAPDEIFGARFQRKEFVPFEASEIHHNGTSGNVNAWNWVAHANVFLSGALADTGDSRFSQGPWVPTSVSRRVGQLAMEFIFIVLRALVLNDAKAKEARARGDPGPWVQAAVVRLERLWNNLFHETMPPDISQKISLQLTNWLESPHNHWIAHPSFKKARLLLNFRDYYQIWNVAAFFAHRAFQKDEVAQQRRMLERLDHMMSLVDGLWNDNGGQPLEMNEQLLREVARRSGLKRAASEKPADHFLIGRAWDGRSNLPMTLLMMASGMFLLSTLIADSAVTWEAVFAQIVVIVIGLAFAAAFLVILFWRHPLRDFEKAAVEEAVNYVAHFRKQGLWPERFAAADVVFKYEDDKSVVVLSWNESNKAVSQEWTLVPVGKPGEAGLHKSFGEFRFFIPRNELEDSVKVYRYLILALVKYRAWYLGDDPNEMKIKEDRVNRYLNQRMKRDYPGYLEKKITKWENRGQIPASFSFILGALAVLGLWLLSTADAKLFIAHFPWDGLRTFFQEPGIIFGQIAFQASLGSKVHPYPKPSIPTTSFLTAQNLAEILDGHPSRMGLDQFDNLAGRVSLLKLTAQAAHRTDHGQIESVFREKGFIAARQVVDFWVDFLIPPLTRVAPAGLGRDPAVVVLDNVESLDEAGWARMRALASRDMLFITGDEACAGRLKEWNVVCLPDAFQPLVEGISEFLASKAEEQPQVNAFLLSHPHVTLYVTPYVQANLNGARFLTDAQRLDRFLRSLPIPESLYTNAILSIARLIAQAA